MRRTIQMSLAIAAFGFCAGFEDPNPAARDSESNAKAGDVLNIGGVEGSGGTIKGVVKFSGKQAKQGKYRTDADPKCHAMHKDSPLLKEKFVFGKDDTLQNVFVYISKGLEGKTFDPPARKAVLDQRGCVYIPHVSGVVVRQTLDILNSDETTHNVKLRSKNNGQDNKAMPTKGMVVSKIFKKPEMSVKYVCDVHNWMGAYVHVMSHPYFAVTQENGTFEIRGVPAGEYEISPWHEFSKFKPDKTSVAITVVDGETAEVAFTYSPPKKKR